ncbi:hypothetical protein BKA69DRAFT_1121452 [Paraphysoderma sedebokerense]|nr:hypothetical protein BKA69DRAFT_1121452 [Paraphysoderma sedebokerense]
MDYPVCSLSDGCSPRANLNSEPSLRPAPSQSSLPHPECQIKQSKSHLNGAKKPQCQLHIKRDDSPETAWRTYRQLKQSHTLWKLIRREYRRLTKILRIAESPYSDKYYSEAVDDMRQRRFELQFFDYNTFIHAYTRSGRIWDAMDVYKEMISNGVKPNQWTFNLLLSGLVGHQSSTTVADMGFIRTQMLKYGARPDKITYGIRLSWILRRRDYIGATHLLAEMDEAKIPADEAIYRGLIWLNLQNNDLTRAEELWIRAKAENRINMDSIDQIFDDYTLKQSEREGVNKLAE